MVLSVYLSGLNKKFQINLLYIEQYCLYIGYIQKKEHQIQAAKLGGTQFLNLSEVKFQESKQILEIKIKLTDLEEVNLFISLLKNVQYLHCDLEVEDILSTSNKLNEVAPYLRLVNSRYIRYETYIPATQEQNDIQTTKQNLFKLAGNYRLLTSEQMDESSVWYLMDELASSIQHSDTPNVSVVPFLYLPNGKIDDDAQAYSILIPIKDIHEQPIFRDFLSGVDETKFKSYRLNEWFEFHMILFQVVMLNTERNYKI